MLIPRLVGLLSTETLLTCKKVVQASKKHPVVSLFSGVGGLELAFSSPKPERDGGLIGFCSASFSQPIPLVALDSN